jgi:hypothetical protein
MANINAPFGLRLIGSMSGSADGHIGLYYAPSTYATALFIGDPVVIAGTANASDFRGHPAGSLPTITLATAGATNKVTGAVVGFEPAAGADLSVMHGPASTDRLVLVADDRDAKFVVQADGTFAVTGVGLNVNLVSGTGSTVTGNSGWAVDISEAADTATFQCKILGVLPEASNEIGDYTKLIVSINNHSNANAVVGL